MKLLIHIGYPKTATTTLQNNLLENLNKRGNINFIGRSELSNKKEKSLVDFLSLRRDDFNNFNLFKKDKLNVLSEEVLSINSCIKKRNGFLEVEDIIDRILILKKNLASYFNDDVEIKILITLRNQVSLLESLYKELYGGCLGVTYGFTTIEKFINNLKKDEIFKNFFYADIIKKYKKHFDVELLLYEDLLNKDKEFFDKLSCILEISKEEVQNAFNKKLNTKNKQIKASIGLNHYVIGFLYKTNLIIPYLYLRKFNLVDSFTREIYKLLGTIRIKDIEIKGFSEKDKEEIFLFYKNSNELLNSLGVNKEKLIKYNYI